MSSSCLSGNSLIRKVQSPKDGIIRAQEPWHEGQGGEPEAVRWDTGWVQASQGNTATVTMTTRWELTESRRTSSHKSRTIFRSIKWELTIRIKSRIQLSIFTFTFYFHALEKEMATHSSVLAWRIPGTGEPRGLPSMGSHRVGHDWSDLAAVAAAQITAPPSKDDAKDVSGSSVDENPPACLCRGHHFDPWSGKIPRAAE